MEEIMIDPWCLTLPEEMADARDFKAEQAIELDLSIKLPSSFSLWTWIYKTNYQWSIGSCTANSNSHGVQVLNVRKNWVVPTNKNIITPSWRDLWTKMGHNPDKYDGGDYAERAVNVALKEWIYIEENGEIAKFDGYAVEDWTVNDKWIELIKRYLYKGCPIIWVFRWDSRMRSEMTAWEVKSVPQSKSWGHCVCLVGWDEWGFWFVNSWQTNDWKKLKSRFYVSYNVLKKLGTTRANYRYRVLYIKEDAKLNPEYLKRKNVALAVLQVLKKQYPNENAETQAAIVVLSQALRKAYPELNTELPL